MDLISLLPADTYTVINKSTITEDDKQNIISLYQPLIGPIAVSLYFTLLHDIKLLNFISNDHTHYHLMVTMSSSIETIKKAREALEGIGLLKTYYKEGETDSYVYELYSPVSPKEFFASPIFNVSLYNNIGKKEYELLKAEYELPKIDLKDYQDISKEINVVFQSSPDVNQIEAKEKTTLNVTLKSKIDFDLLIASFPKGIIKESTFTKKTKELIEQLAFIYDLDTLKMVELIRMVVSEKGTIDKEQLRLNARKYYQYDNNGKLPTLVYRTQPEYLKTPTGDNSQLAKIIYLFENTSPYDFLRIKNNGSQPTQRELRLLETLLIDLNLQPAVVNVLVDYVLKKNNNKLNKDFVEAIASQWKRCKIETVQEAMELAKKENSKYNKKIESTKTKTSSKKDEVPEWFNKEITKEEMSAEDKANIDELFSRFE